MNNSKSNIVNLEEFERARWNQEIDRLIAISRKRPFTLEEKETFMFLMDGFPEKEENSGPAIECGP